MRSLIHLNSRICLINSNINTWEMDDQMDKDEFSRRVLEAESSLYRVAKTILRRDEDCADAIQNGILHAFQKIDTLRNVRYFKTWLTRIVINECYQILRQEQRQIMSNGSEPTAQEMYTIEEESMVLQEFRRLPEQYRIPIELHDIEGYSVKEIGEMLSLTETNVRNRIFRGKKILRKILEGVI